MKLIDTILLFAAFALFMIGIHQVVLGTLYENYWIIMLSMILFGWYGLRKVKSKKNNVDE